MIKGPWESVRKQHHMAMTLVFFEGACCSTSLGDRLCLVCSAVDGIGCGNMRGVQLEGVCRLNACTAGLRNHR